MRIERISLRSLTVSILIVLGMVSIFLLFITTLYFRDAALKSQGKNLSRVMDVASQEVVKQLHSQVFGLGSSFQNRGEFRAALEGYRLSGSDVALRKALDDPIVHGFVGAATVDLVKMRVYDLDLNMIAQSDAGLKGLKQQLSPLLQKQAEGRTGAERLKAVSGLWISPTGPLYSVLLPVGGMRLTGYIEVVANPTFNLAAVAEMTRMPLTLYGASGEKLYQSENTAARTGKKMLAVQYVLRDGNGEPAYMLVGEDNVEQLDADMARSGIIGVLGFVILVGLSVMMGLWFFNRFLFLPMRNMQSEMERSAQGDLSVTVGEHLLMEFHALAAAFNTMARKVEGNIHELQRLSSIDGLTGVNNRRQFDLSLHVEWQRALRNGQDLSLIMFDIDYFKQYNDAYGHLGGDDCLRIVSALLRECVRRPSDFVARYGGEEFAILLPDTPEQSALFLAGKISEEIARLSLPHASSPLKKLTVSMGCASCKVKPDCQPSMLVSAADKALYRAKAEGRNRFVAADEEMFDEGSAE